NPPGCLAPARASARRLDDSLTAVIHAYVITDAARQVSDFVRAGTTPPSARWTGRGPAGVLGALTPRREPARDDRGGGGASSIVPENRIMSLFAKFLCCLRRDMEVPLWPGALHSEGSNR